MAGDKSRLAGTALSMLRARRRLKTIPSQGGMMEVLLLSIIARGSTLAAAREGLDRIKKSVVNWNELRVTQASEVAGFLSGTREAESKASAIHDVLSSIFEQTHDLEFGFLDGASTAEARDFLRGLGALTDEVVDEVVLAGRPHFHASADGEVVRVARRLGLGSKADSVNKCQQTLEELLGADRSWQFIYLARELAEAACTAHSPKCAECALAQVCPSARKSRAKGSNPAAGRGK